MRPWREMTLARQGGRRFGDVIFETLQRRTTLSVHKDATAHLIGTDGVAYASMAAIETRSADCAKTRADLIAAAQVTAFS